VTAPEVIVTASTRVQIDTPLLEVTGDVTVGGSVDAAVDVKAGPLDVSLVGHTHGMAGHTHVAPSGGGPTGPPTPASTAAP
jgi:phage baseplate assembly protein gpV